MAATIVGGESSRRVVLPVALVTGASRGIGRAIAEALLRAGCEVHGTTRDPVVAAASGPSVAWHRLDLAEPGTLTALLVKLPRVDVLVNNAGENQVGPVEEIDEDRLRRLFEVDFFGPVRLARAYVPGMRERAAGLVVNVGSMRSEVPTPFTAAYSSAKAALRSFSDSLRLEVAPFGVRVCLVAPFHVRTGLVQEPALSPGSAYAERVARARARRECDIAGGASPDAVAAAVVRLLSSRDPPPFVTVGRGIRLQAFLLRHLPRRLVGRLMMRRYGGR